MKVPFLDPSRFAQQHVQALQACFQRVLLSGRYVLGPELEALEAETAAYLGCAHTVGVGSGTDALQLALLAAGAGPGDEVITTPFTFAATIEAIQYTGASAVLVDIDPLQWTIDPDAVAAALTPRTRALVPVHLFGLPANMVAINAIAEAANLSVIEDAAQSLGARCDGHHTGTLGRLGAFSFYPSKTLGGLGDAGLVCCHSTDDKDTLLQLRNHGLDSGGVHQRLGYNSRLDETQAAVLRYKLTLLDDSIRRRNHIAQRYREALAGKQVQLQTGLAGDQHAMGYFTLWAAQRDHLREQLAERGVATALYYGRPVHAHPCFADSCQYQALPAAEHAAAGCFSLPMFAELSDIEVDYICDQLQTVLP